MVAAALMCAAPLPAQADSARMELGRRYTQWLYAGQTDTLWALFSPEMRRVVPSAEAMAGMRRQIDAQIGTETEVLSERVVEPSPGVTGYIRSARFSRVPMAIDITVVTDASGIIQGLGVRPQAAPPTLAPTQFLDYQTKTPLRLPFDGDWYVFWGGRTLEQNYHAAHADQRFAYDIIIRRDGSSHSGDGTALEQYYCWAQPILAPGAGTVVTALDTLPDQRPGMMDPANPPGNHVIVDHGNGEFSLLAHLRRGSVAVRPGQRVEQGQKLGECGNSGNTSEPHLHYHLQNAPVFGAGQGLPALFDGYVADGQPVERGEPVKGQTVRHGRP
ncbi:MAG TPA: M23 family metallopeptidase [Longimicrobium sp.]